MQKLWNFLSGEFKNLANEKLHEIYIETDSL